jgi:hypothetical protein
MVTPLDAILPLVAILAAVIGTVTADISLAALSATTYDASSQSITLSWTNDGTSPPITDYTSISFLLCTGPNSAIHCFTANPLAGPIDMTAVTGNTYTIPLASAASLGANGPYFIQVAAFETASSFSLHYTSRFSLTGMTGTYVASSGGDVTPPPDQPLAAAQLNPAEVASLGSVPYAAQTGPTRYAPMQLQPGSTVTIPLVASRRYPTSAVTYFKSEYGLPSIQSTITPGWSYTFSSQTNYASTMPPPTVFYKATAVIASSIEAVSRPRAKRWID